MPLTLHKTEDRPKYIERLEAEHLPDPRLAAVLAALRAHRYAEATALLQGFVAAHAQVRVWKDSLLAATQLEIRRLEAGLLALEAKRTEAGRLLTAFELGELLQEVLALRRDVASHQRHASAYAESEYQRAHQRYQQQAHATAAHSFALDANGRAALKKLYREAAQLCHPNRVADQHKSAVTAAFQQVLSAYQRQDVAVLQTQLLDLRRALFAPEAAPSSLAQLQARRDALAAALLRELAELRASEALALAQADEAARAHYLATNRAALLAERARLQAQLTQLSTTEAVAEE